MSINHAILGITFSLYKSQHHSQEFPNMSYRPHALGSFFPASWDSPPEFSWNRPHLPGVDQLLAAFSTKAACCQEHDQT